MDRTEIILLTLMLSMECHEVKGFNPLEVVNNYFKNGKAPEDALLEAIVKNLEPTAPYKHYKEVAEKLGVKDPWSDLPFQQYWYGILGPEWDENFHNWKAFTKKGNFSFVQINHDWVRPAKVVSVQKEVATILCRNIEKKGEELFLGEEKESKITTKNRNVGVGNLISIHFCSPFEIVGQNEFDALMEVNEKILRKINSARRAP